MGFPTATPLKSSDSVFSPAWSFGASLHSSALPVRGLGALGPDDGRKMGCLCVSTIAIGGRQGTSVPTDLETGDCLYAPVSKEARAWGFVAMVEGPFVCIEGCFVTSIGGMGMRGCWYASEGGCWSAFVTSEGGMGGCWYAFVTSEGGMGGCLCAFGTSEGGMGGCWYAFDTSEGGMGGCLCAFGTSEGGMGDCWYAFVTSEGGMVGRLCAFGTSGGGVTGGSLCALVASESGMGACWYESILGWGTGSCLHSFGLAEGMEAISTPAVVGGSLGIFFAGATSNRLAILCKFYYDMRFL